MNQSEEVRAVWSIKRRKTVCPAALLMCLLLWWGFCPEAADAEDPPGGGVRRSILQGAWYPADPGVLSRLIHSSLSDATPPEVKGRIRGLVVPHAGYQYSGPVAAHAYRLIQGRTVERVVLVGPSHRMRFDGISVSRHDAYETPLGRVPVDRSLADRLIGFDPEIRFVPDAHAVEHSLEIQLPFLQTVLKDVSIVPVIMGRQDPAACSLLAEALVRIVGDDRATLIVASTDLSHFHDDTTARALDRVFTRHVKDFDPEGLSLALAAGQCEACGGGAVVTVLTAFEKLGAGRCVILEYATSGDVTGDRKRVVGYLSAAILE
ncbi:MAG: AmmeMemoRadiSam system protein B [Thermodesulfobacteriota bacterium]